MSNNGAEDHDFAHRDSVERRFDENRDEHRQFSESYGIMRDSIAEIRYALETGRRRFEDHEARLSAIEPKAKSWAAMVAASALALTVVVAAMWQLGEKFDAITVQVAAQGATLTAQGNTLTEIKNTLKGGK